LTVAKLFLPKGAADSGIAYSLTGAFLIPFIPVEAGMNG